MFWRKRQQVEEKPEHDKVLYVPREHLERAWELWDKDSARPFSALARYKFWEFIENIFPEENFVDDLWEAGRGGSFKLKIMRKTRK